MPDFKVKMQQIRFRLGEKGRGRLSPNVRDALTPLKINLLNLSAHPPDAGAPPLLV